MSLEEVRHRLKRFVSGKEPEVLYLKGGWGTGKTHEWRSAIKAVAEETGKDPSVSYVSLYGINTLNDLRLALLAAFVEGDGDEGAIKTGRALGSKAALVAAKLTRREDIVSQLGMAAFKDRLVCLDDLERKGPQLSLGEIFGFAHYLKEDRNCRVAIIVNKEMLEESEKDKLPALIDKTVDVTLSCYTTPTRAAEIGAPGEERHRVLIREFSTLLGVTNIRVLKKAAKLADQLIESVGDWQGYHDGVLREAIKTLCVLLWSKHVPGAASTTFMKDRHARSLVEHFKKVEYTEQEKGWHKLLDEIRFEAIDEFDEMLNQGIEDGYFSVDVLRQLAKTATDAFALSEARGRIRAAWILNTETLADNYDDVVAAFREAVMSGAHVLPIKSLDGVVLALKSIGEAQLAVDLIGKYAELNPHVVEGYRYAFEWDGRPEKIEDPAVIAFGQRLLIAHPDQRGLKEILGIPANRGLTSADFARLAEFEPADLVTVLQGLRGEELEKALSRLLSVVHYAAADVTIRVLGLVSQAFDELEKFRLNVARLKKYREELEWARSAARQMAPHSPP